MSDDGPLHLSTGHVMLAAFLLMVNAVASLTLQLGLEQRLLIAAVRAFCQLMLLGYILVPIFKANNPLLIMLYAIFMGTVATYEAQKRTKYGYKDMFAHTWLALAGSAALVLTYGLTVVVAVQPWWEAQYLIPVFGMLLGNTTNGISVGLATTVSELAEGRQRIEALLAMGATRWEASKDLLKKAVTLGLTPILNQMSIIGMVSIPGMMTGQILGGTSPEQAARYQCAIIFLIAASTALGTVTACLLAVSTIVDVQDRVRAERLVARDRSRNYLKDFFDEHVKPLVQPRMLEAKEYVQTLPRFRSTMNGFQRLHTDIADI